MWHRLRQQRLPTLDGTTPSAASWWGAVEVTHRSCTCLASRCIRETRRVRGHPRARRARGGSSNPGTWCNFAAPEGHSVSARGGAPGEPAGRPLRAEPATPRRVRSRARLRRVLADVAALHPGPNPPVRGSQVLRGRRDGRGTRWGLLPYWQVSSLPARPARLPRERGRLGAGRRVLRCASVNPQLGAVVATGGRPQAGHGPAGVCRCASRAASAADTAVKT